MENRTLLNDKDCEKIVIGTLLSDRNAIHEVRELLSPECFYQELYRNIYKAILSISERGEEADVINVRPELRKLGVEFEDYEIFDVALNRSYEVYKHAAYLHDLEIRRRFYEIGQYLVSNSLCESEDIVDVHTKSVELLNNLFTSATNNFVRINEALEKAYQNIYKNIENKCELTGFTTGFEEYDKRSGGLQGSDLIVIAGERSMGKTSFAMSLIRNSAIAGAKWAIYSMEMKDTQIAARMMAMESGIPANEILYSRLSDFQLQEIDRSVSKISNLDIYFDDRSSSNSDVILNSIRSMKHKFGIDGVMIDYLQMLSVNDRAMNTEQKMGEITRKLKNIAKELNICVIALSQLSRDKDNPVPTLNRLRSSGQIEEAADNVILIYRPEFYGANKKYPEGFENCSTSGTALIDIAKGRNIGTFKFICGFTPQTTNFYNIEKAEELPFEYEEKPGGQWNDDY